MSDKRRRRSWKPQRQEARGGPTVGFAVNYYSRPAYASRQHTSTRLSLESLRSNSGVGQIILVDGSANPDLEIQGICRETGVDYIHTGRELSYAQGFNAGWRLLREPHVGLMANDVFPSTSTVAELVPMLERADVGCVFPYLTYCDYPGQIRSHVRSPISCEPSAMTLNMLVIRRQLLRRLGGVNEKYSGGYNDLLLLMGVRRMGYRVVLVGGTHVAHLGQMTIVNGSNYSRELDKVRFASEHGDYVADHGLWQVKHWKWPLATTHGAAMLWRLAQTSPSTRVRQMLQRVVLILEPELTAFPASRGTHPGARREAISTSN